MNEEYLKRGIGEWKSFWRSQSGLLVDLYTCSSHYKTQQEAAQRTINKAMLEQEQESTLAEKITSSVEDFQVFLKF